MVVQKVMRTTERHQIAWGIVLVVLVKVSDIKPTKAVPNVGEFAPYPLADTTPCKSVGCAPGGEFHSV